MNIRMKSLVVCLVALVTVASADNRVDSWADNVFRGASRKGIDPMNMAKFDFKIKSTGITNRQVNASFLQGSLSGISRLQRHGGCSNGTRGNEFVIGCNVMLQPIIVQMNADVKGDVISGITKHINTLTNVASGTYALVEFHGRRSGSSFSYTTALTIKSITLTSQLTGSTKLDLNGDRMKQFFAAMNDNISKQINNALQTYYKKALTDSANGY